MRRRLQNNSHKIGDAIPGGMADVETSWPSEDRMAMAITAMGSVLQGHIDIEDDKVLFYMDLPPALGFLKPMVEGAIQDQGRRLLAPPKD